MTTVNDCSHDSIYDSIYAIICQCSANYYSIYFKEKVTVHTQRGVILSEAKDLII